MGSPNRVKTKDRHLAVLAAFALSIVALYAPVPAQAALLANPLPGDSATDVSTDADLSVDVTATNGAATATFYGREYGSGDTFTVIALPDTQNYVASATDHVIFGQQTAWVKAQQDNLDIALVAHLGDVVNTASSVTEWSRADTHLTDLEGGPPVGISPGNHDMVTSTGEATNYDLYIPPSRFGGTNWPDSGYLGDGTFDPSGAPDRLWKNNYVLFEAGGMEFISIAIEYGLPQYSVDWADAVLDAYPSRRAILTTHAFLDDTGTRPSLPVSRIGATSAEHVWDTLIYDHCNVHFVLNGHYHYTGSTSGEARNSDENPNPACDHPVHQMLSDYQDRPDGGNGLLRILTFDAANDEVSVQTYSPYLGTYETDANSQFNLAYDMDNSGGWTDLGTTAVTGDTASISWNDLADETVYEWYVDISDGDGTTTSPIWSFTTEGPPPDTTPPIVTVTAPADSATYEAGIDVVAVSYSCVDSESGVLSCIGDLADGAILDTSVPGHGLAFTVIGTDNATNTSIQTNTYDVVDTTTPILTLLGSNPVIHEAGDAFADPGAQVTDNVDATATITGASTVDPDTPGDYTITYDYADAAGNPAATKIRNVQIVDTTAPIIGLLGANPLVVLIGGSFTDPGATVSDNVDATTTITGASTINTAVPGDYTVTYNHTDAAGNKAATVSRDVEVVDGAVPVDTFVDDDGSIFEDAIEWLAAQGITAGCNPPVNDMFCPDAATTRGQMAAFFKRALGDVLAVDLGNAAAFADTASSVFTNDIAWLSAAGITAGCNPPSNDRFCANGPVTRGQMAAFLHRAFRDLIPTPTPTNTFFTDSATSVFVADIQWLTDTGITKGCGADTFCPDANVTRGQMAAFIQRAFAAAQLN